MLVSAAPALAQTVIDPDAVGYRALLLGAGRSRAAAVAEATAFTLFERGDLDAALQKTRALIEQFRQAGDVERQAVALDFEGLVLQRHGKLDQALVSHATAVQILERGSSPSSSLARINATINLGTAHYFVASYEEAERYLTEASSLAEQSPPSALTRLARGRALNNLGLVYYEMDRVNDARASFDEAAGVTESSRATDDDRQLRAQALNNRGRLLGAEGNVTEARARLTEAQALAESLRDPILQTAILDSLADVLLGAAAEGAERRAFLTAALTYLDKARDLEKTEPNAFARAAILVNRGRALSALGRRPEALSALDDAVSLAENINAPNAARMAYAARGEALVGGGSDAERDRGLADLNEAVRILERYQGRDARGAEREFARATSRLYATLIDALLRKGDVSTALGYVERSKSAALRRELLKRSAQLREADAESALQGAQGLLRQEEALAEEIAALQRAGKDDAANRLQVELVGVRQQAQVAVAEIHQRYGDRFSQYVSVSPETMEGLGPQLEPGQLLVTYFAADDALWLFLVSNPGGMSWRRVPAVGRRELETRIRRYRELAAQVRGDRDQWRIDSWAAPEWKELREITDWLYRALLGPIETEWKAVRHLLIAPTGLLFYLPFHGLGPYEPKTGTIRFIVEDVAVSYVTSASLMRIAFGQRRARGRTVLALGNPTYRHERPALRQLDYAEKEIGTIKVLFGSRAVALSGDQATLASLQTHLASGVQSGSSPAAPGGPAPRAEGFGILHLATHGIVDPVSPADSWLAFEGRNRLRARDIPRLSLSATHLVTLSACETGLAEDRPGTELMSLGRFFSSAGVSSVVVSLWSIDDIATQQLMLTFYRGLDVEPGALDKAQALRDAQRALLANPATRHPFYWAGLVLIGDWR